MPARLSRRFFSRPTLEVAPDLLGKILVRNKGSARIAGRIVEVEAYRHADDPASHAHRGLTPRNRLMFGEAGRAYVYFIYGMYYCVNVVTERTGVAGACLIRALEPVEGLAFMQKRRNTLNVHALTSGPGKLCQALAIDRMCNGLDLRGDELFITDDGFREFKIKRSPRIGIRVGAEKPWRFFIEGNEFVSKSNFRKT